jgi:hypothetical protein
MHEYIVIILDDDGAEHELYVHAPGEDEARKDAELAAAERCIRYAGIVDVL